MVDIPLCLCTNCVISESPSVKIDVYSVPISYTHMFSPEASLGYA